MIPENFYLETKQDFSECMRRIYAWFECEIIDRVPVRFAEHNSQFNASVEYHQNYELNKKKFFDTEKVVGKFIKSLETRNFLAETFPVYWPNLGPDVYAAFYGTPLLFGDITSWSKPIIEDESDLQRIELNTKNEYFDKIEELTEYALNSCKNKFIVGYTDLHPGLDCVVAWRGVEQLCFDLVDRPDFVWDMVDKAGEDFKMIFDYFNNKSLQSSCPSVNWMEIPSFEKVHIPSCDFSTMMSPEDFEKYALEPIKQEVKCAEHNVFHLDGKGVARHLDMLLEIPEIQAIQWVQGVGEDRPIMQWIPLIKRIQDAGKSVIVDLHKEELDDFVSQMRPEGIFIWIDENEKESQESIISYLKKWK